MRYIFFLLMMVVVFVESTHISHALDARPNGRGDPYFDQRQAVCPVPDGTLRGCFNNLLPESTNPPPDQRGLACVYFPCGPANQVVICDPSGCTGGIGEYPLDLKETYGECFECERSQCDESRRVLRYNHEQYERAIMVSVSEELRKHRLWLINVFFRDQILPALTKMTEQLSAVGMHQMMSIGQFFDVSMQLETQRTLQTLKITAHEDYRPSQSLCTFGTIGKSLAASQEKARSVAPAMMAMQMTRELRTNGTTGTPKPMTKTMDKRSRWDKFKSTYCSPFDNGWDKNNATKTGLSFVCGNSAPDGTRVNRDLNYARLIDEPRTIDATYTDGLNPLSEDILALSNNLYGHDILTDVLGLALLRTESGRTKYMDLRSIAAKRGVARHSYNSIVALKSPGTNESSEYLYNLLKQFGMSEDDAIALIGEEPSYYAQLEILAQKMFQNPKFYTKLYDTPANVKRKHAAMLAIERMLDNELMKSQMRQEMLMSVLLSSELREDAINIQRKLGRQ